MISIENSLCRKYLHIWLPSKRYANLLFKLYINKFSSSLKWYEYSDCLQIRDLNWIWLLESTCFVLDLQTNKCSLRLTERYLLTQIRFIETCIKLTRVSSIGKKECNGPCSHCSQTVWLIIRSELSACSHMYETLWRCDGRNGRR